MAKRFYAHSIDGKPPCKWQTLDEHLHNVAGIARSFAENFGAGGWAYLAGIWHDIGKYSYDFQHMMGLVKKENGQIETKPKRVDHSTAGAKHASTSLNDKGKLLSYAIAGHHSGLPDGKSNERSCLNARLEKKIPDYSACPDDILNFDQITDLPFAIKKKRFGFQLSFFVRMIFSCLVDADFLDTERFLNTKRSSWRKGYPALSLLNRKLTSALNRLANNSKPTPINKYRNNILQSCLNAARLHQGLFSLTVPTGGGKTLSSLAFAIEHALRHKMNRIIYVIPYTSIIEQNAAVFRTILGEDAVLEHHSNFEPKKEDYRSRLSSENWDAPLIVTTNVQFFESLFSNKPSRSRKIHNIANSVIILDEAQMLPVPLLKPCIEALRELTSSYRTTIILCSATQPALSSTEDFKEGLDGVLEIIEDPATLYNAFKRVQTKHLHLVPDDELANRLKSYKQVLCIVNTRKHARQLFEKIRNKEGRYHLSALMCPKHRSEVLQRIKSELSNGRPCRVVSTQLVEAGVDIDFPVVFRSLSGIDSLAQAAGRCNREGKIPDGGKFYIFSTEEGLPPGYFRRTAETSETIMHHHDDPLSLSAVEAYFRRLYWMQGEKLDEYQILVDLQEGSSKGNFPFKIVDNKFRLIKDGMEPIIIPFNQEAEKLIQGLRYAEHPASLARKAQKFTVLIPPQVIASMELSGSVELIQNQYRALINKNLYRHDLGLCPEDPTFYEVEDLIF